MSSNVNQKHVVVIGAGPGGYAAAFKASDLGMKVTLIDREENPGGVCLFRGCIPSKALLHASKVLLEAKEASLWGLEFSKPKINLQKLQKWKSGIVKKLTSGLGQLSQSRKLTYIQGNAHLVNNRQIKVQRRNGEEEILNPDTIIIATGSRPTKIPGIPFENPYVMDSTKALDLDEIPKSLLVIGGGYIGLELGTVYSALGSSVSVIEMTSGLLPGVDRDLVSILEKQMLTRSINILLKSKVLAVREKAKKLLVRFQNEKGNTEELEFEKVLVAVGRKPNTSGLGLENTNIKLDPQGFIKVNEKMQTDDDLIFAIGDVAGEPMLAHKASHEGMVAAEVISGEKSAFTPLAIPAVVFTEPEIAWCGITETQAIKDNRPIKVAKFPWGASGRAMTLGNTNGLTKLIIDAETERVLGVGICGFGAGDLIAEGVLAIEMAAVAEDLKLTIHPHPTLSETIMESAELVGGSSTHIFKQVMRKK